VWRRLVEAAGVEPLSLLSSKLMMARDFWQQAFATHHVTNSQESTRVLLGARESASVLATLWQRSECSNKGRPKAVLFRKCRS
jgi:hypothetical protein